MKSLTSQLYRAARLSADVRAIRRGRFPQRLVRKRAIKTILRMFGL